MSGSTFVNFGRNCFHISGVKILTWFFFCSNSTHVMYFFFPNNKLSEATNFGLRFSLEYRVGFSCCWRGKYLAQIIHSVKSEVKGQKFLSKSSKAEQWLSINIHMQWMEPKACCWEHIFWWKPSGENADF